MFLFSVHPAAKLARAWKFIALAGAVFAFIFLGVSLLFPLEYRADAQALIISKSRYGADPYTIAKSAERVGENLAAVMKTDDFFYKVMSQRAYPFDRARFEGISDRARRKRWIRAVKGSVVYGTGVLNVTAYGAGQESARALSSAVVDTLASKGWEYVGGDVTIKVVNQPVASRFPVRPNLFLHTIGGFLLGAALASAAAIRRG